MIYWCCREMLTRNSLSNNNYFRLIKEKLELEVWDTLASLSCYPWIATWNFWQRKLLAGESFLNCFIFFAFLSRKFYICSWKKKTQSYNLNNEAAFPRPVGRKGINLMVCQLHCTYPSILDIPASTKGTL